MNIETFSPNEKLKADDFLIETSTINEKKIGMDQAEETANKMSTRNLDVYYGDKQALFDINVDIPERSVTALIGPSGCGKSTFIRCLNRMNDTIDGCRVEGDIHIDKSDIYDGGLDLSLIHI